MRNILMVGLLATLMSSISHADFYQSVAFSAGIAVTDCDLDESKPCTLNEVKLQQRHITLAPSIAPRPPGFIGEDEFTKVMDDGTTVLSSIELLRQKDNAFITVNTRLVDSEGVTLCSATAHKSGVFVGESTDMSIQVITGCRIGNKFRYINSDFNN